MYRICRRSRCWRRSKEDVPARKCTCRQQATVSFRTSSRTNSTHSRRRSAVLRISEQKQNSKHEEHSAVVRVGLATTDDGGFDEGHRPRTCPVRWIDGFIRWVVSIGRCWLADGRALRLKFRSVRTPRNAGDNHRTNHQNFEGNDRFIPSMR